MRPNIAFANLSLINLENYFEDDVYINLVSIFRCSSSKTNPVYGRRVNSFVLVCSLSSHRHLFIPLIFGSRFIDSYNKLQKNIRSSTDTHIYILSVALVLSIHNKQQFSVVIWTSLPHSHHPFPSSTLVTDACWFLNRVTVYDVGETQRRRSRVCSPSHVCSRKTY
jgi:hypothetical protein